METTVSDRVPVRVTTTVGGVVNKETLELILPQGENHKGISDRLFAYRTKQAKRPNK